MNAELKWTNLTPPQVVQHLQKENVEASVYVVKQLLEEHDYVKRQAQKKLSTGDCVFVNRKQAVPQNSLLGKPETA